MNDARTLVANLYALTAELGAASLAVESASANSWVAVLLIDGRACYFIGGPMIDDPRIFSSPEAALGALAYQLGYQAEEDHRVRLHVIRYRIRTPQQREIGKGWIVKEIEGAREPMYFPRGPDGPAPELHFGSDGLYLAWNRAYDLATHEP